MWGLETNDTVRPRGIYIHIHAYIHTYHELYPAWIMLSYQGQPRRRDVPAVATRKRRRKKERSRVLLNDDPIIQ
jgi:hypothetical protein